MADLAESVVVFLRANIGEFTSKMREAGADVDQLGSTTHAGFSKVKVAAGLAAAGVAGAALAIGASSVKAAVEGEKSNAQLRNAIHDAGQSYAVFGPQVEDASTHLAKFGFQNDEVETSIARMTRATKDPAAALKAMGLVADIARGRNISLADATSILLKVQTGHVGALGRLGIATKDVNGKTISQAEAMKKLAAMYGGAAQANAGTLAGKQEALDATMHNLEERIGQKLLPVVAALADFLLSKVIPAIEATVSYVQSHWPQVQAVISESMDKIRTVVTTVVGIVESLWARFGSTIVHYVTSSWGNIVQYIKGVVEAIKGVVALFSDFFHGHWSKLWGDVLQIVHGASSALLAIVSQAWDLLKAVLQTAWNAIKDGARNAWDALVAYVKAIPGRILSALGDLGKTLLGAGAALIGGLGRGIVGGWAFVASFFPGLPGRIVTAIGDLSHTLWDVGWKLISGLWQGIKAGWNWLADHTEFTLPKIHIPLVGDVGGGHISLLPHLAKGGPVRKGALTVVGEEGTELYVGKDGRKLQLGDHGREYFVAPDDGMIYSHPQLVNAFRTHSPLSKLNAGGYAAATTQYQSAGAAGLAKIVAATTGKMPAGYASTASASSSGRSGPGSVSTGSLGSSGGGSLAGGSSSSGSAVGGPSVSEFVLRSITGAAQQQLRSIIHPNAGASTNGTPNEAAWAHVHAAPLQGAAAAGLTVHVHGAPGQSVKEIAHEVMKEFQTFQTDNGRSAVATRPR